VPHSTAALVLAAGGSRRLGRPKQLIPWRGRPLLEGVLTAVARWPADQVVVVIGAYEEEILAGVEFGEALIVLNPDWEEGIAASIRVGLDVLTRDRRFDRAFIALGDQPRIPDSVPEALLEAMESSRRPAAVPKYRYDRANPVLVHRSLWPRLMSLEGDSGAARLLRTHPEWVEEVWIDHLPPQDVDTQHDVADLED
jgi:molybdenum cofactor cytidylyltransferase